MLIPLRTNSLYNQSPFMNWLIMGVTIFVSFIGINAFLTDDYPPDWFMAMVLDGWGWEGMLGHMLLHGGVLHLLGNMVFLWVFGNAVCAKTGSIRYLPVYIACGIGAAAVQNLMGGSAIGASGAINGIVGFYLVLQPVNDVDMLFLFFLRVRRFSIAGYWVILYWAVWDIFGAVSDTTGSSGIAYGAHVGGLITGIILGFIFVLLKQVKMDEYDNPTLPEYLKLVPMGYSGGYFKPTKKEFVRPSYESQYRREHAGRKTASPVYQPKKRTPLPPPPPPEKKSVEPPISAQRENQVSYTFDCPHCSRALEIDSDLLGQTLACPACSGSIEFEAD